MKFIVDLKKEQALDAHETQFCNFECCVENGL